MDKVLVVIKPDGTQERKPFRGKVKYEALRDAVGGTIAIVPIHFEGRKRQAYCRDDGLLVGLPFNMTATHMARQYGIDEIVGNVAVIVRV